MRRWNGWGDDHITYPLSPHALTFLSQTMGPGRPRRDARLVDVLSRVPPSALPDHPLLTTDPEERLRHALGQSFPDWVDARFGTVTTFPDAVAFPLSNEDVRTIIAFARDVGARLIPYGGGTSVVGHLRVLPEFQPVISVDMRRMNRLLHLDEEGWMATFQAGVRGPHLEAFLRARGFTLGHFPQSFEYSTLGGWVATRSVGQESLGYGRMDELFLGGRVETPRETWLLRPFPASAAGPDLRQAVLGSEGRLGIITEVTVRVRQLPAVSAYRAVFFPTWEDGLAAVREMAQDRVPLSMLRLSTPLETRVHLALAGQPGLIAWLERWLALRGAGEEKCLLVLGASGSEEQVRRALGRAFRIARAYQGVIGPHRVAGEWVRNRFRSPYLRNTLWEHGYGVDTVETAVPWSRVPAMVAAMETALRVALEPIGERVLAFSHLSHVYPEGSSVYTTYLFRLAPTAEETRARWEALKAAVSWAIVAYGGTISHQHGVGLDHAAYMPGEKGGAGHEALAALLRAVDPEGMMNPGKLLPGV